MAKEEVKHNDGRDSTMLSCQTLDPTLTLNSSHSLTEQLLISLAKVGAMLVSITMLVLAGRDFSEGGGALE